MNEYEFLGKYAVNLTEQVKNNEVNPIIGRDEEIRNVIRILSRKTKNNPVLIGEPGVGKTAIVEGLAQRIIADDVPNNLKDREIWSLDLGLLVAGAKYQGEFEERLKGVMSEVTNNRERILLFIDEIHLLIGAGKTSGALDAANLLKPALARGELHAIGATTLAEYRENIETDSAFERRFQRVLVHEPTKSEALSILRGIKESLEVYHSVEIEDAALKEAVDLSTRYINDRFLPDKAIDLVDEAAANINVQINSEPEELERLNRAIVTLEIEKKAIKKSGGKSQKEVLNDELKARKAEAAELESKWNEQKNLLQRQGQLKYDITMERKTLEEYRKNLEYEKAAEIEYAKLPKLEEELQGISDQVKNEKLVGDVVTPNDIMVIVSRLTNIPLEKLSASDKSKLLHLNEELNEEVLGQEQATEAVSKAIIRSRVDLGDPGRPIGSFLFLGPTGVGKTEVAKTLAGVLFDDKNKIFRIDMSEYMEKHSVSRLIGSPPGYIGYEQGGALTEYVRRNPYSLILFDEIEKAHPEVLDILLQILDEGHITDSRGNTINFKNTVIILTSNIGSRQILEGEVNTDKDLTDLLQGHLKPELINRIDNIIKFNALNKEVSLGIIRNMMNDLKERLNTKDHDIEYSDDLIEFIYDQSYVEEFGARPFKRYIQNEVESEVAEAILTDDKEVYTINVENDKIVVS